MLSELAYYSMILDISNLMYLIRLGVLFSSAFLDSFPSSRYVDVKSSLTSNETVISYSPMVMSLILWKQCSWEVIEYLLLSMRCPRFFFCQFFSNVVD